MDEGVDFYGPVKTSHKVFCLSTLEKFMKDQSRGSYPVMKSTPRFPGGRTLMDIGYKYNYRKFLGYISTEGVGSTEPCDPYLSRFPYIYSNVSVRPVVCTRLLGRHFNAYNAIDNQNSMLQSYLELDKYWVTQRGYFRLATTVALGMGITDVQILFCHGFSEGNVDK